jgi:hypothetical protein
MEPGDLLNRFGYHPPMTDATVRSHERLRGAFRALAQLVDEEVPDSREKSLSITKIEEAMFWANAGIARIFSDPARNAEPEGASTP